MLFPFFVCQDFDSFVQNLSFNDHPYIEFSKNFRLGKMPCRQGDLHLILHYGKKENLSVIRTGNQSADQQAVHVDIMKAENCIKTGSRQLPAREWNIWIRALPLPSCGLLSYYYILNHFSTDFFNLRKIRKF